MEDKKNEPQVTPLRIYNPGDKDGEYFNLDTVFMLTLESFDSETQILQHAMAAPGFYLPRSGKLIPEYRPDIRPLHRHALTEVMYVIHGEITQYIEDDCRIYRQGQCCILNKNVLHVESYSSDFEAVFLMLSDDFIHTVIEQDVRYRTYQDRRSYHSPLYRELQRFLGDSSGFQKEYLDFTPAADAEQVSGEAEELFHRILRELLEEQHGYMNVITGLLARFFGLLADGSRYRMACVVMQSTREDYLFNRIKLYLRRCGGRIDYGELEDLLHYTRDYLNRIVRRRSGKTLGQLAQEVCLEEAARQLLETDRSVSEIIHSLNYSNRSYFYRIFQEKYGMTPRQYRQSTQES